MSSTHTSFTTKKASQYLQQLCKHFGHKVPVTYTPEKGVVTLPFGTCNLAADSEKLTVDAKAAPAKIAQIETFIGDHLARFAFRENPALVWRRT